MAGRFRGALALGRRRTCHWIAVSPEGSDGSAQEGYYAVYLFAADGSAVYLSFNQGTENVRGGANPLRKSALDLRLAGGVPSGEGVAIDLRSKASRPKKYEAGNAYALRYDAGAIPGAERVAEDL